MCSLAAEFMELYWKITYFSDSTQKLNTGRRRSYHDDVVKFVVSWKGVYSTIFRIFPIAIVVPEKYFT